MDCEKMRYEGTVDIKHLLITILRKWWILLVTAMVMALVYGGGAYLTARTEEPTLAMSEEEIVAAEALVAQNKTTIARYQTSIFDQRDEQIQLTSHADAYRVMLLQAMQVESATPEFLEKLMEITEKIADFDTQANQIERRIAELDTQILVLQEENQVLTEKITAMAAPGASLSEMLKKAVFGFILGMVLGILLVCQIWILNGKLQTAYSFKKKYGIPILTCLRPGVEPAEAQKHGRWNRWLDKLAGADKPLDIQAEYAAAAAKIQVLSGGHKRVLIAGTARGELLEEVASNFRTALPEGAPELVVVEDFCGNREGILMIPESAILLVEVLGDSRVAACTKLCEFLAQAKADVIGAVMI